MSYYDSYIRCKLDRAKQVTGIRPNYIYGLLYNWYAASDSRIGNSGFTVPTALDGAILSDYYNSINIYINTNYNIAPNNFGVGNHLKSCRQVSSPLGGDCDTTIDPRWNSDGINYGRDSLLFSALPGGLREHTIGVFSLVRDRFYMRWRDSVSNSYASVIQFNNSSVNFVSTMNKRQGTGIRLARYANQSELLIPEGEIIPNYYKGNNDFLYDCVRISNVIWLAQNLAETKWSDGTDIPFAGSNGINYSNAEWAALTTPAVCAYDNDVSTWAYTLP